MGETPERLYSVRQVADRYGAKISWVYHCKNLHKYSEKVGKYLMWRESKLEEFEANHPRVKGLDLQILIRHAAENRLRHKQYFGLE